MLVVTSVSQAIVADRFKCAFELKDKLSKVSTRQQREFYIARLPLNASPAPDIRLTAGLKDERLVMETESAEYNFNINFYYNHAIKIDNVGHALEARQMTCLTNSYSYCPKWSDSFESCRNPGHTTCQFPRDPFNDESGWLRVPIIEGEPGFSEQTLGGETFNSVTDSKGVEVATFKTSCQYMGTYQ